MTAVDVRTAYAACEQITRREARNFSYGIRLLPGPKRQALSAVYAMARRIDDIGDGALPADDELLAASDRVCAGLQLVEHWQDVAEDRRRGRIYLPQDAMAAAGVAEADLDAPTAGPALRRLVLAETAHAAGLLAAGPALVRRLHGWARWAVTGYVAGGRASVDALRRSGGDVLAATPRPRRRDLLRHAAALALPGGRR